MHVYQVQRGASIAWRQAATPLVAQTLATRRRWALKARTQLLVQGRAQTSVSVYRPGTDILITGWTPSTGVTIAPVIGELIADDATYATNTDLTSPLVEQFDIPVPAGPCIVKFRGKKAATNGQLRILLLDSGLTIRATGAWHPQTTGSWLEYTDALAAITVCPYFRIEVQT